MTPANDRAAYFRFSTDGMPLHERAAAVREMHERFRRSGGREHQTMDAAADYSRRQERASLALSDQASWRS